MKLKIRVANPAGNITVLVETMVKASEYAQVAGQLLAAVDGAEQVGFLVPPLYGGDVRLAMMGGEFCGNALRSTALYNAVTKGMEGETMVYAEISGAAKPLKVLVNPKSGAAQAEMMLPQRLETIAFENTKAAAVLFEGIIHIITDQRIDDFSEKEIKAYLRSVAKQYQVAAAGLMFFYERECFLSPAVYVVATDTLFYENSCASGSAAVAAYVASQRSDDTYELELKEPGGLILAAANKRAGVLTSLQIGGTIALSEEMEVRI